MTLRKATTVVAVTVASMLSVPVAAMATTTSHAARSASASTTATQATSFANMPVSGKAKNGKAFTGHMTVTQFVTRHGKTFAVGTLTGRIGNRTIKRTQVAVPATLQSAAPGSSASSSMHTSAVTGCGILHLVLGPLNLNLLGLHVTLNQVDLNVTAIPGAGNLLGNLLCGVANLLNGTGATGANLTGLLNIVQQLTSTPGLLSL